MANETIELMDGTKIEVRPLKVSLLRPFMKEFEGVAAVADAVVIGSRLVQEIIDAGDDAPARLQALLAGIRAGMDSSMDTTA